MKKLTLLLLILASLFSYVILSKEDPFTEGIKRLPVQHEGRVKPWDTVARNVLLLLKGNQKLDVSPARWLLDATMDQDQGQKYKVFRIDHPQIKQLIGPDEEQKYFSYQELEPYLEKIRDQAKHAFDIEENARDAYHNKTLELWEKVVLYLKLNHTLFFAQSEDPLEEIKIFDQGVELKNEFQDQRMFDWFLSRYQFLSEQALFAPLPPLKPEDAKWKSIGEGLVERYIRSPLHPGLISYGSMMIDYKNGDLKALTKDLNEYTAFLNRHHPHLLPTLNLEVFFNKLQPFTVCILLYLAVFVLQTVSFFPRLKKISAYSHSLLIVTFVLHTLGLLLRMYIDGRPPVTNLYSSAVFVGWGAVFFSLILEKLFRNGFATLVGSVIGSLTLIIAHHLAASGDTIEMMRAVLNSNFWLSTHVVCITIGYSATFLAGTFGCLYTIRSLFGNVENEKELSTMVYGIVCFAMFFSFIGTVLGGIWADQSWGRFWGWDPKENGALMIVLWNAIVLHARWGSLVKTQGLMLLAVFGNIITSFSWFGVNMLGVGLHSYGFIDSAFFYLIMFVLSQLVIIALGLFRSVKT